MVKYEYKTKTLTLKQKGLGFISRSIPDLEMTLNHEGNEGWRLCEIVIPSAAFGDSTSAIVIFEKKIKQNEK